MHCYACDDNPAFNYGDVLLPSIQSILTRFGVLKEGRVVGLSSSQQEKSLLEMNLFVNTEFDFSMVLCSVSLGIDGCNGLSLSSTHQLLCVWT